MTDTATYTRTAVLSWASRILRKDEFHSFTEIPASDLALLLYGIINNPSTQGNPRVNPFNKISLQEIQFPVTLRDAALTDTVRLRNTQHVLALVRTAAAEAAAFASQDATIPQLALSSTLTAVAWMAGKSFVEELKVWRWVRALAEHWTLTEEAIQHHIQCFLGNAAVGDGDAVSAGGAPVTRRSGRKSDRRDSSSNSSSRQTPSHEKEEMHVGTKGMERTDEPHATLCTEEAKGLTSVTAPPPTKQPRHEREETVVSEPHAGTSLIAPASFGDVPADVSDILWRCRATLDEAFAKPCSGATTEDTAVSRTTGVSEVEASLSAPVVKRPMYATLASSAASGEEERTSSCGSCPAVFALALAGNMQRIEQLEKARRRAIGACLRKDMTELIGALSEFA